MSSKNYRRAFESDIFFQKNDKAIPPAEKLQFNYKIHPKDKVESLPKYMATEPDNEPQSGKKTYASNPSDILNIYAINAPLKKKQLGPRHHLSKSQVEMGDDQMEVVHKNRTKSMEKFPQERSAYSRKMEEFYGKNYLHNLGTENNITSRSKFQREIMEHNPIHKTVNEQKYSSNIGINEPCYDVNNLPKKIPIRVRKVDTAINDIQKKPFERKVNFLKSNLFNSPEIATLNSSHSIIEREKPLDAHPIKSAKRATSMDMNQIFDWRESKNNIWLSKCSNNNATMSAKERKLKNIYGSLDNISTENMKESLLKRFYENKNEINSKAKEQFQGKGEDFYKKQCENMSILNGTDFYKTNYQLNNKKSPTVKDVTHSFEIDNINENDIKQVKKFFSNSGIHVYDTEMHDFKMNSVAPGKISVKIRENENDQNFQKNLIKAKDKLKKEKGLELKIKTQQQKSKLNALPQSLQWNDAHLNGYIRNRFEENTDNRTHMKGYGKNIHKKEKVTNIPYNLKYKNSITKNF